MNLPSINQIAIMGEITGIQHKPGRVFPWNVEVNVYREYGGDDAEAHLVCGVGSGFHADMIANARVGDWVAVQGKIKTGGFIQVRCLCVFQMTEAAAVKAAEQIREEQIRQEQQQEGDGGFFSFFPDTPGNDSPGQKG